MQIQVFRVAADDPVGVEELNRFLRGHRVLSVDRHFEAGIWHFCVCHQPSGLSTSGPAGPAGSKVDYRATLDAPTFALFSRLRETRKQVAEKEGRPPYAIFTNEQLADVARRRPASLAALGEVPGSKASCRPPAFRRRKPNGVRPDVRARFSGVAGRLRPRSGARRRRRVRETRCRA
jgi:superfamily II DNA helicase RecQ